MSNSAEGTNPEIDSNRNILLWENDIATIIFIDKYFDSFGLDFNVIHKQYPGSKFSYKTSLKNIEDIEWMRKFTYAEPKNIISCFKNEKILEAVYLVTIWGGMSRTNTKTIYIKEKSKIKNVILDCKESILQSNKISNSWNLLVNELEWSNVMTSKTLHFLTRSLGYVDNPAVPIDNKIFINELWPILIKNIEMNERPKNWKNGLPGYLRYMTFINWICKRYTLSTTQVENTLFKNVSIMLK